MNSQQSGTKTSAQIFSLFCQKDRRSTSWAFASTGMRTATSNSTHHANVVEPGDSPGDVPCGEAVRSRILLLQNVLVNRNKLTSCVSAFVVPFLQQQKVSISVLALGDLDLRSRRFPTIQDLLHVCADVRKTQNIACVYNLEGWRSSTIYM